MEAVSITELRKNAKTVFAHLAKHKKPIAVLQRSKPVAYIIDVGSYNELNVSKESDLSAKRAKSLDKILEFNKQVSKNAPDIKGSVELVRDLRGGLRTHE